MQAIDSDKTLHNVVSRVVIWLTEAKKLPWLRDVRCVVRIARAEHIAPSAALSDDTGAGGKARKRLPEKVIERLLGKTAQKLEAKVTDDQLWCGRRVYLLDGSSVIMSDTCENQKASIPASESRGGLWLSLSQNCGDVRFGYWSSNESVD